jgi:hypothetical protein
MLIHGVDFTSAPGRRKGITVASGRIARRTLEIESIVTLEGWPAFEAWLALPGPWVGGFDFPFGLPREAVKDLGWPQEWPALVQHCASLGRVRLREALDAYRTGRAIGNKYPHRLGDRAAGSHSPVKLVNPPVALMFLEGAPRLLAAGVHMPSTCPGDRRRVALEAYPGFAIRQLVGKRPGSYKNDARAKQTIAQRQFRSRIVKRLIDTGLPGGVKLAANFAILRTLVFDGTGDRLDAVLCAMQAAQAWKLRKSNFGLPAMLDPLEGWIATVPAPPASMSSPGNIRA